MKKTSASTAIVISLAAVVALAGCKKKEESVLDASPAPMAASAPVPVNEPVAAAPAVSVSAVTVGKTAAADKSVATAALFAPKDKIIVSVRTGGSAANVALAAKLTYQDGQVAGEQSASLNTSGDETTNIEFSNANGWPKGKYRAEVTVNGAAAGTVQEFEVK